MSLSLSSSNPPTIGDLPPDAPRGLPNAHIGAGLPSTELSSPPPPPPRSPSPRGRHGDAELGWGWGEGAWGRGTVRVRWGVGSKGRGLCSVCGEVVRSEWTAKGAGESEREGIA